MTLVEESCMLSAKQEADDDTSSKKEIDLGQVRETKVILSKETNTYNINK